MCYCSYRVYITNLIARFMGPTWGPPGTARTQVGPMLTPWTLLSGKNITWHTQCITAHTRSLLAQEGNMCNTLLVDGLVPLGVWPAAGTTMTKFGFRVFKRGLYFKVKKQIMASSLTYIGYHSRRAILSDQCRQRSPKCTLKGQVNKHFMMTSSSGNIFREFTGHRWIPLPKASDAELWCFLWYALWINGWVNNCEAGDLKRHCVHYDVIVMSRAKRHQCACLYMT